MKKLLIALSAVAFLFTGNAIAKKPAKPMVSKCAKMYHKARKCALKKRGIKNRKARAACWKPYRKVCGRCYTFYRKCIKKAGRNIKKRRMCVKKFHKCRARLMKRTPMPIKPIKPKKPKPVKGGK